MSRYTRRQLLINCLGLGLFAVTLYLSVVVFCLVLIGSARPGRPEPGSAAWRLLTAISPVRHHHATGDLHSPADVAMNADELGDLFGLWPWEQMGIDDAEGRLNVHVIASTRSRARRLALAVRDHLANGHDQVDAVGRRPD